MTLVRNNRIALAVWKAAKRVISKILNCKFSDSESFWIGTKHFAIIKNEKQGFKELKLAEKHLTYQKEGNARNKIIQKRI